MEKLEPPMKKYLTGRRPTHSSSQNLHQNFASMDKTMMVNIMQAGGYMNNEGAPTRKSLDDGLIDTCERKALWNLDNVEKILLKAGLKPTRQSVNQEIKVPEDGKPRFVNLGTIATYFNVTANTIGKWLDALELRDSDGMGNEEAMDKGLATIVEMSAGPNKTRKIAMWELVLTQEILLQNGHELDFDYNKTLKGNAKNSDVQVSSIDERAKEFAKEFISLIKDPKRRYETEKLVRKTPKPIVKKAEELMKKPGFITTGKYLNIIKRK